MEKEEKNNLLHHLFSHSWLQCRTKNDWPTKCHRLKPVAPSSSDNQGGARWFPREPGSPPTYRLINGLWITSSSASHTHSLILRLVNMQEMASLERKFYFSMVGGIQWGHNTFCHKHFFFPLLKPNVSPLKKKSVMSFLQLRIALYSYAYTRLADNRKYKKAETCSWNFSWINK